MHTFYKAGMQTWSCDKFHVICEYAENKHEKYKQLYMHVCICACACMHTMYEYTVPHTCGCDVYACMHAWMDGCADIHVCVCAFVFMYAFLHVSVNRDVWL